MFIVAGEESSDAIGAALVRQLKRRLRGVNYIGYGGKRMSAAGVRVLYDLPRLAVVGFVEVLGNIFLFLYLLLKAALIVRKADLVLLIDYPGFNLALAKWAFLWMTPVIYYISPQLWAWKPRRVRVIRRCVDRMLVIFPFEVGFYRSHGVKAEYVGHPLLERKKKVAGRSELLRRYRFPAGTKLIGLLPGSRKSEVRRLLSPMLETCAGILKRHPGAKFVLPLGSNIDRSMVEKDIMASGLEVKIVSGAARAQVRAHLDLALVASGTATLETALSNTPMLILYKTSPITYIIAKRMVKLKYIGMVNILAGREIVPEFIQGDLNPEKIARVADGILRSSKKKKDMKRGFSDVRRKLGRKQASEAAAASVASFLRGR